METIGSRSLLWLVWCPALIMSLLLSGCGTGDVNSGRESDNGLANTLAALRSSSGLYVDPTYYQSPASVYSTALIDDAVGRPESHPADAQSVVKEICSSDEKSRIGGPWFGWAVSTALGKDAEPCLHIPRPKSTGDPATDIPVYFAWTSSQLVAGVPKGDLIEEGRTLLKEATGAGLGAYVMWRADQLEELLGLPSTAAQRVASPPANLHSPDDLTELWGYTMRCENNAALCQTPTAIDDQAVADAAVEFPDDLSLAGGLAILRARGATEQIAALTPQVEARRIPSKDLLRGTRFDGSVDATFEVLRLAPELFPGPDPQSTASTVTGQLATMPPDATVRRLHALAVLKAVNPDAWDRHLPEVNKIFNRYNGAHLTEDSVKEFTQIGTVFGTMQLEGPMATLTLFDVRDAESEYHARLAVGASWAFTNQDEVLRHFAALRKEALAKAETPTEPIVSYLASLDALNGGDLVVDDAHRTAIIQAVNSALRGCELNGVRTDQLYRFTLDPESPCSLQVSLAVLDSGFGR